MTQKVTTTHAPTLEAQVSYAKRYAKAGYKIIATALSWGRAHTLAQILNSQGIPARAVALGPLADREDSFDCNTFVLWSESDPRAIEAAREAIARVRAGAEASGRAIRIVQASPLPQQGIPVQRKGSKPQPACDCRD